MRKLACRSNKDTNGSYGTVNEFGTSVTSRVLTAIKSRKMNFPELAPAYVIAILENQGHSVTYGENTANPDADITLMQSSLVHFNEEYKVAADLKAKYPHMRVGFFSGVTDVLSDELLQVANFVIVGEIENALLNQDISDFEGKVLAGMVPDLDSLPYPSWHHVSDEISYKLLGGSGETRLAPMLASRGCPMSCRFYCTYPWSQGMQQRKRSVSSIVAEIQHLKSTYGTNLVLFRDPIFTLDMPRTKEFCRAVLDAGLKISYIIETHTKFIDDEMIDLLSRSGCVAIQFGIESGNADVMEKSKRKSNPFEDQRHAIRECEKRGIKVLALFMLAYFDDTVETVEQTIDYAIDLNPYGAQFTVATPYPGTPWYDELKQENERYQLSENYDDYTQYRLVYNHPSLDADQVSELKNRAYRRFYYRFSYFRKHHLPM